MDHFIPNRKWLIELRTPIVATEPPTIAKILTLKSYTLI